MFHFFQKNCQWQNENFWQVLKKKCQVFGDFLTVKWQFSGGSDCHPIRQMLDLFLDNFDSKHPDLRH